MADFDTHRRRCEALPLPDEVALVLQGGGALGAYQAGVYEALHDGGIETDWVAGISIGAVNAAIIAGNPPEQRVPRLREFWDLVTSALPSMPIPFYDSAREVIHEWSAGMVATFGVPSVFCSPFTWWQRAHCCRKTASPSAARLPAAGGSYSASWLVFHVSKSSASRATTSIRMLAWDRPQNSAHWPA